MAITPAAGYQMDPNNPNAVIPIGSQAQAQGTGTYSTPQPSYVNPNVSMQVPTTTQQPAQIQMNTNAPSTQTPQTAGTVTQPQQTLAMPVSGSVVDLLNMAGQDSSYAARQQLAQKYGIQNYTGTATQNQELSQKYLEAYNALKSTQVPQNTAEARSALTSFQDTSSQIPQIDAQSALFDGYADMNPVVKSLYDQLNTAFSSTGTKQTLTDEFNTLRQAQGVEGLQTELLNTKRIMDGTEDDIRSEITNAGGFATESQVLALSGARNKTLIKQAQNLSDQLAMKNDYIDQVMRFSEADRTQVEKEIDRKLGLAEKIADLQTKMENAAKENYQKIVDSVGYGGLASMVGGDTKAQTQVERILSLPKGALSNQSWMSLQSSKNKQLQFISGTANQSAGVFNQQTGVFTPISSIGRGTSISSAPSSSEQVGTSGSVARDADSVMAGNLNLQDISTKNNYRALVASEINKRAQKALDTGDLYGVMRASAAYDKEPSDTFLTSMEKVISTLGQIGVLQENIQNTKTGPIVGSFRGANPWDTNAQTIKAQLNAIVPNLARGVYGEVGVLTDNDIKTYSKTLPTITSTEDVRNAILYITVDMIRRNVESKIRNQAAGQRDMSGYANIYQDVLSTADGILSTLPNTVKPGYGNTKTTPQNGDRRVYEGWTYIFNGNEWKLQK